MLLFPSREDFKILYSDSTHDPTEVDGRHIQLRREKDASMTLREILRHNHKLRSLIGIRAPMLLAARFDTAKVRIAMAVMTKEDSKGPPPANSPRWYSGGPLNHDYLPHAPITKIYLKGQTAREVPSHPEGDGSSSHQHMEPWTRPDTG